MDVSKIVIGASVAVLAYGFLQTHMSSNDKAMCTHQQIAQDDDSEDEEYKRALENSKTDNVRTQDLQGDYSEEEALCIIIKKTKNIRSSQQIIQELQGEYSENEAYQFVMTDTKSSNLLSRLSNGACQLIFDIFGSYQEPKNMCLANALTKLLLQFPNHDNSLINELSEKELKLILNNELRSYYKEQPNYYEIENKETKEIIASFFEGDAHLPPNLIETFITRYFPDKSIMLYLQTHIVETDTLVITYELIGKGQPIQGYYILLTSALNGRDRQGGHFELIKSDKNHNKIIEMLGQNIIG